MLFRLCNGVFQFIVSRTASNDIWYHKWTFTEDERDRMLRVYDELPWLPTELILHSLKCTAEDNVLIQLHSAAVRRYIRGLKLEPNYHDSRRHMFLYINPRVMVLDRNLSPYVHTFLGLSRRVLTLTGREVAQAAYGTMADIEFTEMLREVRKAKGKKAKGKKVKGAS